MVVHDIDTSSDRCFQNNLCTDEKLISLSSRVIVSTDEGYNDTTQSVVVKLSNGQEIHVSHDLSEKIPMSELEAGLRNKAKGLIGKSKAEELWHTIARIESISVAELVKQLN